MKATDGIPPETACEQLSYNKEDEMFSVLIFEDDLIIQKGVGQIVTDAFAELGRVVHIYNAGTVREAIEHIDKGYIDLFLLDIAIPKNNKAGIEVGKYALHHPRYADAPIIYITANPGTVFEAINETHCYQFLEKPFRKQDLVEALKTIFANKSVKKGSILELEAGGKRYRLIKEDIVYIECMSHDITVWLADDVLVIKNYSLKQLLQKLSEPFVQCHKSYIVNMNYVIKVDASGSELLLRKPHKNLPIGRAFKPNLTGGK